MFQGTEGGLYGIPCVCALPSVPIVYDAISEAFEMTVQFSDTAHAAARISDACCISRLHALVAVHPRSSTAPLLFVQLIPLSKQLHGHVVHEHVSMCDTLPLRTGLAHTLYNHPDPRRNPKPNLNNLNRIFRLAVPTVSLTNCKYELPLATHCSLRPK